jgi:hypothetical protein
LLLGIEVVLCPSAVEFVLLGLELCFEGVEICVELIDPFVVGLTVSL